VIGGRLLAMTDAAADDSGGLDGLRERLDRANHAIVSEEEEREIFAEVREQAKRHPGFRAWLRGLPWIKDGTRAVVLEALATHLDAHGELVLAEFDAALALVDQVADPRDVLYPFYELTEAAAGEYRRPLRDRLGRLLRSAAPEVRRWAADMLEEFIEPSDTELVLRLRTLLEQDADFRVRDQARRTLKALELLPAGFRSRLLDRLRARFLSRM